MCCLYTPVSIQTDSNFSTKKREKKKKTHRNIRQNEWIYGIGVESKPPTIILARKQQHKQLERKYSGRSFSLSFCVCLCLCMCAYIFIYLPVPHYVRMTSSDNEIKIVKSHQTKKKRTAFTKSIQLKYSLNATAAYTCDWERMHAYGTVY